MKFAIFSAALCLLLITTLTEGQSKQECRTTYAEQNRKQLKSLQECTKQLGCKTGREKAQKSSCVMKCVLQKANMLNDSGFISQELFNKYLSEEWSSNMRNRANTTLQPCLAIGVTDAADEFCKGYDPLVKCLNRSFSNLCKGL